jgi:hypothetical protein
MYSYTSYGLGISSMLPLPELLPAAQAIDSDILIRLGPVERSAPQTGEDGSYFHLSADESFLFWETAGKFLVRGGREIIIDPNPDVPEQTLRLPLLGTVLAAAIQQRGLLGLHASAVSIDGQAVAFIGYRGQGKSTMAAALVSRGHQLLADDLVVLDNLVDCGRPRILPAFPQLKLFPEAAAASLGDNPDQLPRLIKGFEKRSRRITEPFSTDPVELKKIFFLETDTEFGIEPIKPQEAVINYIRHSYVVRIFRECMEVPTAVKNLKQCSILADNVTAYRLKRPRALCALQDVASMVEKELERTE